MSEPTPLDSLISIAIEKTIAASQAKLGIAPQSGMRASRRMDKLPPGDVSLLIQFVGQNIKALAMLTYTKDTFGKLFSKLTPKAADLSAGIPDEVSAWVQELGQQIATELRAKNYPVELALCCGVVGQSLAPYSLNNAQTIAIPFESPAGTFHGEFTITAPSDIRVRVPKDIRILVADDSPMARKGIIRFLNTLGFSNIIEQTNGEDALYGVNGSLSLGKPFDLILCDYHMPKMDGVEFLKKLRANDKTKALKFIMFTGDQEVESVKAAVSAGVNSYIVKPVTLEKLAQKIEAVFTPPAPKA